MSLLYKPDWSDTKARYLAWWSGEEMARCMLWVTAPRDGASPEPPPPEPEDPLTKWTDLDYIARRNRYEHEHTFYGADAFPIWNPGYPGHVSIPTFLGCKVTLDQRTGWWDPILVESNWDISSLRLQRDGRWWQFAMQLLQREAAEARGKSIPSTGAFGGVGDTLAALRGTEPLMYDLADSPEKIRDAELHLVDLWIETYQAFHAVLREAAEGSAGWFRLWSPKKFYAVQCDVSYMISPASFREIYMPAVRKNVEFLDHSIYHVDGPGAFKHVPALCEIPQLQALQILPGDGQPSPLHFMDTLRHVQRAGKNLWIQISAGEVKQALDTLSSRGLYISINPACANEAEARELIENCKRWSRVRN